MSTFSGFTSNSTTAGGALSSTLALPYRRASAPRSFTDHGVAVVVTAMVVAAATPPLTGGSEAAGRTATGCALLCIAHTRMK